ncbi:hypothetical protein QBC40DRAFT_33274 [Triangularia verruculosa]|uniref:Uncharacterized protein n=1 Tax=Triangularia verruculosa TaxID=2587418 RepID=A0AAN7APL8_9PEZI|nr:hypothetical protein QBC40DRAFT_33274 [Triangularia verruculosa]
MLSKMMVWPAVVFDVVAVVAVGIFRTQGQQSRGETVKSKVLLSRNPHRAGMAAETTTRSSHGQQIQQKREPGDDN